MPDDFSVFLHGLRTRELERLPPGAKVVLSGGAAGTWYFEWFESHYPTPIDRHIGVEALAPKPEDLPAHVEWVPSSLGDLSAIRTGSVDLVFAGEVIEHLWPDDIAGFLSEAHRVLRRGAQIAFDSPNRRITQAIRWFHPEHTVEFTVDEIVELLEMAGFDDVHVRGVLLGYDVDRHRYLLVDELESAQIRREERLDRAADRPEDSFVWWAEATRSERRPDDAALLHRVRELFWRFRTNRFAQLLSAEGRTEEVSYHGRVVHAARGEPGFVVFGPYIAMPPGTWEAVFELSSPAGNQGADGVRVCWIDVVHGNPPVTLGRTDLTAGDLGASEWSRHAIHFATPATTMGVEFRVFSEGHFDLAARAFVDVRPTTLPTAPQRQRRGGAPGWLRRHPRMRTIAKEVRSLVRGRRWCGLA